MNWRERWARFNTREKRLIIAAVVVLGLLLLRMTIVSPFLTYRENLADQIAQHREWLENASAYLARAGDVERDRDKLRDQVRQIRAQLVPGETPDLAAANLQETLHNLAKTTLVEIRSTQKMRDEPVDDFRRIAVRITVTGEVRALAQFLSGIEYSEQRLLISFFEISQRGAVLRNQGPRMLSATIEVSAFIQGTPDVAPASTKEPKPKKPRKPRKPRPERARPRAGMPAPDAAPQPPNAGAAPAASPARAAQGAI